MGLFTMEACTFCQREVGMRNRSRLASGEYICNDCRSRLNAFARMDSISRSDALKMAKSLADDEAWYDSEVSRLGNAERRELFSLGRKRVTYVGVAALGVFRLSHSRMDRYQHVPVLRYGRIPESESIRVAEFRDPEGKLTGCELIIPYRDGFIRDIRLGDSVESEDEARPFYELAERIMEDRSRNKKEEEL